MRDLALRAHQSNLCQHLTLQTTMTKEVPEESFESGDLLEAFKRLNEGEKTATELEKMLDSIESKIKKLEEVANFDVESKPKSSN